MKRDHKVDALIIGAQKAGTTSLYNYLNQHPGLEFSKVKEIPFFGDVLYGRGIDHLHGFFEWRDDAETFVSADVHLLASEQAPAQVYAYNPRMKFILVLRDPVDRAWSAYWYAVRNGWESESVSFEQALALEGQRLQSKNPREQRDLAYLSNGMYWHHLQRWLALFPREAFFIVSSTELRQNAAEVVARAWGFLGLDSDGKVETTREYNRAGRARLRWVYRLLYKRDSGLRQAVGRLMPARLRIWIRSSVFPRIVRLNTAESETPRMPADVRLRLEAMFCEDMRNLQQDFGVRLTAQDDSSSAPPAN